MKVLSEDLEVVKLALSKESSVIELNEDKTLVRRKIPLPESRETLNRTVYVKGFPQTCTLDELQEFFENYSKNFQAIRLRRHPKDRVFKGSVFIEFETEEEASRFVALNLSYKETPLVLKTKMAYFSEKNQEKTAQRSNGGGAKSSATLDRMGRGRLIKIGDFPGEGITHESLKETLKDSFAVAYVDFEFEPGCAWVRFREAVAEKFAQEYAEKGLEVNEHRLTCFHVPSEEEQAKYYDSTIKARKHHDKNRNNNRRFGNKRHSEEPLDEENSTSNNSIKKSKGEDSKGDSQ